MIFILQWIDLLWLPIALVIVHKKQRLWVLSTLIMCMIMMRLQVELIEITGHDTGFLSLLGTHALNRALAVYSIFYLFYFIIAYFSPRSHGVIFMAASIAIFFMAFFTSTFILLL